MASWLVLLGEKLTGLSFLICKTGLKMPFSLWGWTEDRLRSQERTAAQRQLRCDYVEAAEGIPQAPLASDAWPP